jgi:hypothetical protein
MSFAKAASLIASENGIAAFAFYPTIKHEAMAGGTILTIYTAESDDISGWEINVSTGLFNEPGTESERLRAREFRTLEGMLGVDPRHLRYRIVKEDLAMIASWCGIKTALGILHGLDELDAERLSLDTTDLMLLPGNWQRWLSEHLPGYYLKV